MGNAASCCGCECEWHSFISIVRYKKRVIEGWRGREWTGVLPSNEAGGSDISPILDGRDGVVGVSSDVYNSSGCNGYTGDCPSMPKRTL